MKSIMISIQPKWCAKIASGAKTIEVRKTRPKIETPFRVYVYCTKAKDIREDGVYLLPNDSSLYLGIKKEDLWFVSNEGDFRNGKVIGEFVCNNIEKFVVGSLACDDVEKQACLSYKEICDYFYGENYDNTVRIGYGWHISELKIYDKPKELGEFRKPCAADENCYLCEKSGFTPDMLLDCFNFLTRPPQSWCYVEELEE